MMKSPDVSCLYHGHLAKENMTSCVGYIMSLRLRCMASYFSFLWMSAADWPTDLPAAPIESLESALWTTSNSVFGNYNLIVHSRISHTTLICRKNSRGSFSIRFLFTYCRSNGLFMQIFTACLSQRLITAISIRCHRTYVLSLQLVCFNCELIAA